MIDDSIFYDMVGWGPPNSFCAKCSDNLKLTQKQFPSNQFLTLTDGSQVQPQNELAIVTGIIDHKYLVLNDGPHTNNRLSMHSVVLALTIVTWIIDHKYFVLKYGPPTDNRPSIDSMNGKSYNSQHYVQKIDI